MAPNIAKRGRPKNCILPDLIREGKHSESNNKCDFCHRNFPRSKSLNTHVKIHTNEKPYECTYPECFKFFRQSGQLKNHVRRHTGEKPFACPERGCPQRFIHSSRKCPQHPGHLVKDGQEQICIRENLNEEELRWFEEYRQNRGRPAKRKLPSNQGTVKRFKYDDSSSSSSSDDSCSSTDYSAQETFEDSPKNVVKYLALTVNEEVLDIAETLCSMGEMILFSMNKF